MSEINIDLHLSKLTLLQKYMKYYIDRRAEDWNPILSFENWFLHNLTVMEHNRTIDRLTEMVQEIARNCGLKISELNIVDDLDCMNRLLPKQYLK